MIRNNLCWLIGLLLISQFGYAQQKLLSPDEFLPHKVGEAFTPHHKLVAYFKHVADNSPLVMLREYGLTNENRPQLLAIISSAQNLDKLDQIITNNLIRAGMAQGQISEAQPIAIVWLGHSVHGNEAAGSESSLMTLHKLANPAETEVQAWLNNTVILLDPSLNPDGYSRYTHWYRQHSNSIAHPGSSDLEHREPWPGGRTNHYFFDLNRDWAWQTQVESRQRGVIYKQWMPHVNADLHEQGINAPYYFPPAAHPYHPYITKWQSDFQAEIGNNHKKYFDQNGWLYFTREVFDLFYPSYADTYSTFLGAIGMTYEQGGSGRAGRAVILENGDTLTLHDRVMHHHIAALSTIEASSKNAPKLVAQFEAYFKNNTNNPQGTYKTFVVKGNNKPETLQAFIRLLDKNAIQYGKSGKIRNAKGFNYITGQDSDFQLSDNDLIISAYQPMSVLAQVLMDPQSELEDSLTYDITSWALPYAYGLEAYALKERIDPAEDFTMPLISLPATNSKQPYAYLASWKSVGNTKFLAALMQKGVKVRTALKAFEIEGSAYNPGTLVITRADNRKMGAPFFEVVENLAKKFDQHLVAVQSGGVSKGSDFGSRGLQLINKTNVMVLTGEGVSSYSFGEVWHYFDQVLAYPVSKVRVEEFSRTDLSGFDVLILPQGFYSDLSGKDFTNLKGWIRKGGKLIAIGSAISTLQQKGEFKIESQKAKEKETNGESPDTPAIFGNSQRKSISSQIPGAVFKIQLDNTHPLGFGMEDHYFSLKTSSHSYKHLPKGWNVGYLDDQPAFTGFVGYKVQEKIKNSTVFAVEQMGQGHVVYMVDNPLFRGFWHQGLFLFGNAVFLVGQ